MGTLTVVKADKLSIKQQRQRKELLENAKKDPFLGEDIEATATHVLVYGDDAVGFFSPYRTSYRGRQHYRVGALYVLPKYRGMGFMQSALGEYLKTHLPALVWVETKNIASLAMFKKLGFVKDSARNFNDWVGHYYLKEK